MRVPMGRSLAPLAVVAVAAALFVPSAIAGGQPKAMASLHASSGCAFQGAVNWGDSVGMVTGISWQLYENGTTLITSGSVTPTAVKSSNAVWSMGSLTQSSTSNSFTVVTVLSTSSGPVNATSKAVRYDCS